MVLLEALLSPLFQTLKKCHNSFQHYRTFVLPPQTYPRRLDPRCVHTHRGTFPLPKMRIQTKLLFSLHLWQPLYLCGFFTEFSLWCFGLSCRKLELQMFLDMFLQNSFGSFILQRLERAEMQTCTKYTETSWLAEHFSINRLIFYNIWNPSNYPRTAEWVQDVGRIWKAVVLQ